MTMSSFVRDVDTHEFQTAVVDRSRTVPVVVDFWAAWCGPCRVLGPILERAAVRDAGAWELVKVDVDRKQALAMQFGVQGIPTVIGFRDGQPVARFTGALPEASVDEWLRQLVPSSNDKLVSEAEAAIEAGDTDRAESTLRAVLADEPTHRDAALALARLLVEMDRPEEALEISARLPATTEVERIQSRARMLLGAGDLEELAAKVEAAPDDAAARLALGRAQAAAGRTAEALATLLEVVEARQGEISDDARKSMLDLFDVLDDQDLISEYRKRLANSLF